MSWDEPWRVSPEMRERHREGERARRERLDRDIVEAERDRVEAEDRLANEQVKVARLKELIEERSVLLRRVDGLQRERIDAEREARGVERRLEYRQRRLERLGTRVSGERRGRPVRVEVDDGAWAAIQREAVRRRVRLVWWVGDMVRGELDAVRAGAVSGRPSSRRRSSPGEAGPVPRQRFLRIDVDDDCWLEFRVACVDVGLTAGRYLGEVAEAEAHRLGWRAG